jgi:hypothetical protein
VEGEWREGGEGWREGAYLNERGRSGAVNARPIVAFLVLQVVGK